MLRTKALTRLVARLLVGVFASASIAYANDPEAWSAEDQPDKGRETSKPIDSKPKSPPAAAPPAARPPGQTGGSDKAFGSVGELLAALEASGDQITTLEAELLYERRFKLQGDTHTRYGNLYYRSERLKFSVPPEKAKPDAPLPPLFRSFAIKFTRLFIENVRRDEDKEYVFDGQWLVERSVKQKQYIAREVARPGDRFDPLRLGEGPMPIPIGQKAAEILARYDADMPPLADGVAGEPTFLDTATKFSHAQLRLVPKADRAKDDEFREIRLWYARDADGTLLPRLVRTVTRSQDVSFVQLWGLKKNQPLPKDAIRIEPPPEGEGWDVQIEEGRFKDGAKPNDAPAPGPTKAPPKPAEKDADPDRKPAETPPARTKDPTPY